MAEESFPDVGAILLDFHNTLCTYGSLDAWLADACASTGYVAAGETDVGPRSDAVRQRLRSVWSVARELYPGTEWDLDEDMHRSAFLEAMVRDGVTDGEFAAALYELMPWQWRPNDGAIDLVRQAASLGVPLGVVSNIGRDIRPTLQEWGVASTIDVVVLSFEIGLVKPDPRIFAHAAHRLGVAPERCLMIGDSPEADGGAVRAGMPVVLAPPDGMPGVFRAVSAQLLALS